jgi:mannose-6-phosphate isomerase
MNELYPLRFEPIYQQYIWGGRRLETVLGRRLGPGDRYAESWEVCDHLDAQSVVEAGPLAGTALHDLVQADPAALLGTQADRWLAGAHGPRFPLLMKLLDCSRTLSVQVHPDDAMAATLDPPEAGKTEAWYVLAAEPGSLLYAGLRPGVDRRQLAAAIAAGTCAECLHAVEPRPGDCVLVPAGTVHALGEGLLVAEIQQASNTTFRLFDWNRVDADGNPRPLHVAEGLAATDFHRGPIEPQQPQPTGRPEAVQLVECEKFVLWRWKLAEPTAIGGAGSCHIITVIDGAVRVEGDAADGPLPQGRTMLIPASVGPVRVEPIDTAVVLDAFLPA